MIFLKRSLENLSNEIDIQVSETLSEVILSIKVKKITNDFASAFRAGLSSISSRDRFRLSGPMDNTWNEISPDFIDVVSELVVDALEDDDGATCDFELTITKEISEKRCSVYFLDALDTFFKENNSFDSLKYLNKIFDGYLIFEIFDYLDKFGSRTILFSSVAEIANGSDNSERKLIKRNFLENCSSVDFESIAGNFIPSDFVLEIEGKYQNINRFFSVASAALFWVFLANSSKIKSDLAIDYRILGYKSVVVVDHVGDISEDSLDRLLKIFEWAYQGGSTSDKIGLVRNLVSMHLHDDGRPRVDDVLWDAINSNYQIYLKNNIETYLSVKEKVSGAVQDAADKVSALTEEYLNSIKNSVFIVVTFLVTVVLVNGVKDNGVELIFSKIYVYVVLVISIISGGYLIFIEYDAKSRYKRAIAQYLKKINSAYGEMLVASEVQSSRHEIAELNSEYLNSKLKIYRVVWVALFTLFFLFFVLGNVMYAPDSAQNLFDPKNFVSTKSTV